MGIKPTKMAERMNRSNLIARGRQLAAAMPKSLAPRTGEPLEALLAAVDAYMEATGDKVNLKIRPKKGRK